MPASQNDDMPQTPDQVAPSRMLRPLYLILGVVFVALAIIGALLPLMPSTIFIILAAWCFARSSPRLENWLLSHKRFGPLLTAWRATGAIPRRAKIMASMGMAFGFVVFWVGVQPGWMVLAGVGLALGACAWFVVSRPEP